MLEAATATPTLAVLAWVTVFVFANQMSSALLLAAGLSSTILAIAVGNLVLNIALNILLVPRFGAVGVAIALLATESANALLQSLVVWRRLRAALQVGLWLRASGACAVAVLSLMRASSALIPVVLVLYLVVAYWRKDSSVQWLLWVLGPAARGRDEREGIA